MLICPKCKKKYRTRILVCPKCDRELLPPSTMKLYADHPDLKRAERRKKVSPPAKQPVQPKEEAYVDLHRGDAQEARTIVRLLEKEGIPCRVERDNAFRLQVQAETGNPLRNPDEAVVKVPGSQRAKALALLDWEVQKDDPPPEQDPFLRAPSERADICPACQSELSLEDMSCPACGLEIAMEENETEEVEFFCSSCGEACEPDDPVCPGCGAPFDH